MTEIGMTRFRSRGIGMTRMTKNRRPSGGIYTINGFRTFSAAVRRPEENFEFYSLPLWFLEDFGSKNLEIAKIRRFGIRIPTQGKG